MFICCVREWSKEQEQEVLVRKSVEQVSEKKHILEFVEHLGMFEKVKASFHLFFTILKKCLSMDHEQLVKNGD